ncbi:unnamed protein product [Medioppia subpectinata]|uniref:C2H2-type domain-containing protein n=1 Tax=Medioppia subpectinata TaxID=1979941 RepID=A0A7R9Q242_9ACAR|nr:unnamed protein product [Medioppia subpectinata]CAG2109720.1 unnamed protein product [Medioppia subpectinata]
MASIHTSVLVSIKTLCPEVDDYWLSISPSLKTIDGLKQHILTDNCIVKDMDDVELYLSDGLLRGHSSIGDVLQNRDCIELRAKQRINSLPDITTEPALECNTIDGSDDETMGDTSGVQTIVKTESICGNQLNCDRKPSIDPFISSPPKVFIKSEFKHKTDAKIADKSVINECKDKVTDKVIVKSESNGSGDCPLDSTASISSAAVVTQSGRKISADNTVSHKSTKSSSTESASVVDFDNEPLGIGFNCKTISTKKVIVKSESSAKFIECPLTSTKAVVTQSDGKCLTKNIAIKTLGLVVEPRNLSFGDVLMSSDCIEVRPKFAYKRRISSLPDSTIGHTKPVKSKANGSVDYLPNSMDNISSATAVVTQSGGKCHTTNVAIKTMGPVVEPQKPSGSGQTGKCWLVCREPECDYKTQYHIDLRQHNLIHRITCDVCVGRTFRNRHTFDEHYRTSHPNYYLFVKEVNDTKKAKKSVVNDSGDRVAENSVLESQSGRPIGCRPDSTASISSTTAVVTQSGDKWHTNSVAMNAKTPEDGPQRTTAPVRTFHCHHLGCDYKTQSRWNFLKKCPIHCPFLCQLCNRQRFKTAFQLERHHRTVHPNDFPDMPWLQCTHEGCVYQTKDKTLCPEVDDYWLSISPSLKTIDGLKQHILSDNCIVKDMDDVELYLSDGLLRGHSFIAGVIRDRDRIEMRIKYMDKKRINSSADSTSGYKRSKSSVNECIIVEDSDDETMSGLLVVKTEKTSGNQLNCDRKPSIDPFISSPPKVFIKSEFKHKTDTKRADKSVINEFKDKVTDKVIVKSEPNGSGDCPPDSTASILSAAVVTQSGRKISADNTVSHKSTKSSSTERASVVDSDNKLLSFELHCKAMAKKIVESESNAEYVECPLTSTASISSATPVVTQLGGKRHTTNVAIKTLGPVVEPKQPSGSGQTATKWWRLCREPDCHYKTESLFELHQHKLIHRTRCELCTVRIGRTFKNKRKLDEHHRTSHPNHYPIIDTKRTDKSVNNWFEERVAQKVKSGSSGSNVFLPISTASISSDTAVVTQSGGKCHTTNVAIKTLGPVVEPQRPSGSDQTGKCWLVCCEPKCGYKTEYYTDLHQHKLIHRITCDLCVGRTFGNRRTFDNHYRTSHPNYYSFVKEINGTKSAINESGERVADNAILESQSRGTIDCRPDSTASISSAAAVVTQSGDKWRTKSVAMKTNKPMSVSAPTPGTGSTGESRTNVVTKPQFRRKWLPCRICRSLFADKDTQYRHHLCSHPYEFPDVPWIKCHKNKCTFKTKDTDHLNRHIQKLH